MSTAEIARFTPSPSLIREAESDSYSPNITVVKTEPINMMTSSSSSSSDRSRLKQDRNKAIDMTSFNSQLASLDLNGDNNCIPDINSITNKNDQDNNNNNNNSRPPLVRSRSSSQLEQQSQPPPPPHPRQQSNREGNNKQVVDKITFSFRSDTFGLELDGDGTPHDRKIAKSRQQYYQNNTPVRTRRASQLEQPRRHDNNTQPSEASFLGKTNDKETDMATFYSRLGSLILDDDCAPDNNTGSDERRRKLPGGEVILEQDDNNDNELLELIYLLDSFGALPDHTVKEEKEEKKEDEDRDRRLKRCIGSHIPHGKEDFDAFLRAFRQAGKVHGSGARRPPRHLSSSW
ncbi:hypothetical protein BGZ65_002443 [Modicella reniformis]|uniref:Uncharacterized protein n=1 Tax=Modicella reniformis TaxID=1440133 RepID=A0A9P6LT58_9FUNG|nr:hypothetical protein BGZ65_002443 [Modicella reniformis]